MDFEDISKEIIDPDIDLGIDYAEVAIDEFLADGVLKEIPIVKTIVGIAKTGIAIKDAIFVKKLLVFLSEFRRGVVNAEDLEKFKTKFDKDKNFRRKATEQIVWTLDKLDSTAKAKISAHLFRAYLEGSYDWQRFIALNNALSNLQEITFPLLKIWADEGFSNMNSNPSIGQLRVALDSKNGKFDFFAQHREYQGLLMAAGIALLSGSLFGLTALGKDLWNFGISKVM